MGVPLQDMTRQHEQLMPQLREAFEAVISSGQFILGPYVRQFEQELAQFCGTRHAIGVASGNDALLVSLMALGLSPGDEVILSTFAYIHTAESVARLGATPVFVDINPRTFNLEPEGVEAAITGKTRAVLAAHMFGLPADMPRLRTIAEAHGLKLVEDADMAIGAKMDGKRVGALGDVGVVSFYPTKNLATAGDAGACLTDDDALADRIRKLRVHGLESDYTVRTMGGNFRLDAIHAAMLSVKLPHTDAWTVQRRAIANRYGRALEDYPLTTPFEADHREHVYNTYTVRLRGGGRDPLRRHLDASGIGTRVYYPLPLHLQPIFTAERWGRGSLPVAEAACKEVLSLPMFPEMTRAEQDEVVRAIGEYFAGD